MTPNDVTGDDVTAVDEIAMLESTMGKLAALMAGVEASQLDRPTPCEEFDVRGLLNHLATWIQVFDRAANETELTIDPMTFSVDDGWAELFSTHAASVVAGLRDKGTDRPMVMMADPIPGSMMMAMLAMEYVAHGWDLCVSTDQPLPYSGDEIAWADAAARGIVQPEHRGPGFFGSEIEVDEDATPIDRFIAFTGRQPRSLDR